MDEAIERGVDIRLGCEVTSLDFQSTKAILADGQSLQEDVIIAADGKVAHNIQTECKLQAVQMFGRDQLKHNSGLWSIARSQLLDRSAEPLPTDDLAYRGTLTL